MEWEGEKGGEGLDLFQTFPIALGTAEEEEEEEGLAERAIPNQPREGTNERKGEEKRN